MKQAQKSKTGLILRRFPRKKQGLTELKLARCMKKLTSTGDRAIFCAMKKFLLCKELFRSDYMEEALLASFRFPNYVERLEPNNLAVLKFWIERYKNKWLKFDTFCNHAVSALVQKHPGKRRHGKKQGEIQKPMAQKSFCRVR